MLFGHEKLDVYQQSISYVGWVLSSAQEMQKAYRHLRDQWIRAAQSIPLNIAEGNGKFSIAERRRYFEIARGSTLECAAIHDILAPLNSVDNSAIESQKEQLYRIVSMLTKLGGRGYK